MDFRSILEAAVPADETEGFESEFFHSSQHDDSDHSAGASLDRQQQQQRQQRDARPLQFPDTKDLASSVRSREIRAIASAHERVSQPDATAEVVLIRGETGIGKSTLGAYVDGNLLQSTGLGFFAAGQFQSLKRGKKYGAVAAVANQLCGLLRDGPKHVREYVGGNLGVFLTEEELGVFSIVAPAVMDLVPVEKTAVPKNKEQFLQVFGKAFVKFLGACTSEAYVTTVLFDNLERADGASRDLLDEIAKDSSLKNLLLIGAFCDDDPEGQPFQLNEPVLRVTEIRLHPLSIDEVSTVLALTLRPSARNTNELARVVHEKTAGSPLYVREFLQQLNRDGLVYFDRSRSCWRWSNPARIHATAAATVNVANRIRQRIESQSADVQLLLALAACLGGRFKTHTLELLLESEAVLASFLADVGTAQLSRVQPFQGEEEFVGALEMAVTCGFLTHLSETRCGFSSEDVRQASRVFLFSNHPKDDGSQNHSYRLGVSLLEIYRGSGDRHHWMLFSAVDLLYQQHLSLSSSSYSLETDKNNAHKVARLCYEAAQRASETGVFRSAARYADAGLVVLGGASPPADRDQYKDQYNLWLGLMILSVEMNYSCGNSNASEQRLSALLKLARRPQDRYRADAVRIDRYTEAENYQGAMDTGCALLTQLLGVKVPSKPSMVNLKPLVSQVQSKLKGRKASDLESGLPQMKNNPSMEQALRLLGKMAYCAWHMGEQNLCMAHCLTMFLTTLEHGLGEEAPYAMALFGLANTGMGKWGEAFEYGSVAMRMAERRKRCIAKVTVVVHSFLFYLQKPLQDSNRPFLQGFRSGMETGDLAQASACLRNRVSIGLFAGMKLKAFYREGKEMLDFFQEYKQSLSVNFCLPWVQLAENLLGKCPGDYLKLAGNIMDEDNVVARHKEHSKRDKKPYHKFAQLNIHYARMSLLCVMGEFERAEEDRQQLLKMQGDTAAETYLKLYNNFFSALTCLHCARFQKRKTRFFKKQAKPYVEHLEAQQKAGSVNCVPLLALCKAEELALVGNKQDEVLAQYRQSISMASRSGLRLVNGMASERAGEYLWQCGRTDEATEHLQQAWDIYDSLEADAKTAQLSSKYGDQVSFQKVTEQSLISPVLRPQSVRRYTKDFAPSVLTKSWK